MITDLKDKRIIYTFDSWKAYDDLMEYLEDGGAVWAGETKPTEWDMFDKLNYKANEIMIVLKNGHLAYDEDMGLELPYFKDYEKIQWKKRPSTSAEIVGCEEEIEEV